MFVNQLHIVFSLQVIFNSSSFSTALKSCIVDISLLTPLFRASMPELTEVEPAKAEGENVLAAAEPEEVEDVDGGSEGSDDNESLPDLVEAEIGANGGDAADEEGTVVRQGCHLLGVVSSATDGTIHLKF